MEAPPFHPKDSIQQLFEKNTANSNQEKSGLFFTD
jgi:hypothetical protein